VRHRDIHLLTVGRYTYTSDQRFEAMHKVHTEDWILRIRYPQRKDSGIYECQISTTPPIGHPIHLSIVGKFSRSICRNVRRRATVSETRWRIREYPSSSLLSQRVSNDATLCKAPMYSILRDRRWLNIDNVRIAGDIARLKMGIPLRKEGCY